MDNLLYKYQLPDGNTVGYDGIKVNRFTGKTVERITIKAAEGQSGLHTNAVDIAEALEKGTLKKLNISFKPTEIVTKENVTDESDGVGSINNHEDLTNSWDKLTQTANLLIIILVIFAVILAVVVLYSLGLLGFTEVERDMATLKVLGFKTRDLRKTTRALSARIALVRYCPSATPHAITAHSAFAHCTWI